MPQLREPGPAGEHPPIPARPHVEYLVQRSEDAWFIKYDGEEYGPYVSAREAMLFAVDVAHKLGERGKDVRVLMLDSTGQPCATWTHGIDPYPPRL